LSLTPTEIIEREASGVEIEELIGFLNSLIGPKE